VCHESRVDWLAWLDDDDPAVRCSTCGSIFTPGTTAVVRSRLLIKPTTRQAVAQAFRAEAERWQQQFAAGGRDRPLVAHDFYDVLLAIAARLDP
jgi:hypothetical protein